ncbi:glycosyl hydrolase [Mumia sp. DW29H23]|uniref:glycosyl hydrolase n=1 Tax=Mumia sp. DW29H23 TaxID=3421241 RepID=UPI003D68CF15
MSRARLTRPIHLAAAAALVTGVLVAAAPAVPATTTATSPTTGGGTAEALAPRLTASTFADPPAAVRPKYRWWMPQAYTDDDQLRAELADMRAAGAGGAEVAAFTFQGSGTTSQSFLDQYAWGTTRWTDKVLTMLEAADELDLGLDLTVGPRWPAIVPSVNDVNDPRAAQQLVFAYEFGAGGSTRSGALPTNLTPAPPAGAETTLVTALVARCTDAACGTQQSGPRLLDHDSVVEVTGEVADDGTLAYTFPGGSDDTYALITFRQTAAGDRLTGLSASGPNYYLDHLSAQGVKATTDFYDEKVLTTEVGDAIRRVGRVDLYEDSLEIGNTQKWTWDFADQWEERRGYSPLRDLPAIAGAGAQGRSAATFFDFADGVGDRVRRDYRQTWSDLYRDVRMTGLREWAHSHGMRLRVQPYGHPVDTPDVAAFVDVPEGESLAFNHNIEDYKLLAVGAHRSGSKVVSNECCATREKVWDTRAGGATDPGNLQAVYRGYAGGVTQVVWHGYPHRIRGPEGTSEQTRWPGMTYGGNTSFAEAFGAKGGPSWTDYRPVNDNLARMQLVLRQGAPRYDVGVYWEDYGLPGHGTTGAGEQSMLSSTSALAADGYTYEYVSPAHLSRDDARVRGGRLFPATSAYGALVLKEQRAMPLETARRIAGLVRDGLTLVVVGDLPRTTPGLHSADAESRELRQVMADLTGSRRVVRVDEMDDVPAALERAGIEPAAAHTEASADILSVRREDDTTNYYYLFNQTSAPAEQTVALEGAGKPYLLDTWKGTITPIRDYRTRGGRTLVDVDLAAADATVVALSTRRDGGFGAHGRDDAPGAASGGKDAPAAPVALADWSLAVEGWGPGASGKAGDTAKTPLPPVDLTASADGTLPAWSAITPGAGYATNLSDVSGIGTYTTSFTLDRGWSRVTGAYLDLGEAVDTVRVSVNGKDLGLVDPQDLRHVEVGSALRVGSNTVTVRVASTLLNAVRVAPGTGASGRARSDYGLLGPVRIAPYDGGSSLYAEALDRALPVAAGGTNQARIRLRNGSERAVRVALSPTVEGTATVVDAPRQVELRGGESKTVVVTVRGAAASGESVLDVGVQGNNGTSGDATVRLVHSDDLAANALGSPFPRTFSSSAQDRYPATGTTDDSAATFWVSGGNVPGQAPTPQRPETLGVDLGAPTTVSALRLIGRTEYGPRTYEVQTSADGRRWKTVADVVDAPKAGAVTSFEPVKARFVRARITAGYYTSQPGNNTQVIDLGVFAPAGANLARRATASASSTHANFRVSTVNDGSVAGQSDYAVWNAGNGWNDATRAAWPDTLTLTWTSPVSLSRAVVRTVDNGTNPVATFGLRDYDVQALVDGEWVTVDEVRDNTERATLESRFDRVRATALRLSITDTNDHAYSRVVELEAYDD